MNKSANKRRTARAKIGIDAYLAQDGVESANLTEGLTDLVTDMRHFCDAYGVDIARIIRASAANHEAETK